MASLIFQKDVPQDGRISKINEDYDLRVSIIPTKFGEAICLRILADKFAPDLSQLGMEPNKSGFF